MRLLPRFAHVIHRLLLPATALTAAFIGVDAPSMDAVLKAQQVGFTLSPTCCGFDRSIHFPKLSCTLNHFKSKK